MQFKVLGFYHRQDVGDSANFTVFAAVLGIMLFAIGALSSVIGGDPVYLRRRGYVWLQGAGAAWRHSLVCHHDEVVQPNKPFRRTVGQVLLNLVREIGA